MISGELEDLLRRLAPGRRPLGPPCHGSSSAGGQSCGRVAGAGMQLAVPADHLPARR